ncbi:superoxide dismutase family protein [Magnetospirillum molischianum]|uniref:Superoxide dismutase [Cu-Zn] n=1 Tax=Magnetospirillum molischianum DSM 120 TaxID=1150626 RepID=H8FMZ1_MAGML|nr:superoxide dismutase family protein [Magnetospirillum molischianum]CCG39729.1 Superoxide dismutase (Cu-Zn) 1 [Magnetospirillum molischianum DSM 120]
MNTSAALAFGLCLIAGSALADGLTIPLNRVDSSGIGTSVGSIQVSDGPDGLVLAPKLTGLPPGPHGFHVHEFPSCAPKEQDGKSVPALAAGGHFDPDKTGAHRGPFESGHRGDLPALVVAADGTAGSPLLAPHLKLSDLRGHALMIHAGGDSYTDQPLPLGGGGARLACGVVPAAQ